MRSGFIASVILFTFLVLPANCVTQAAGDDAPDIGVFDASPAAESPDELDFGGDEDSFDVVPDSDPAIDADSNQEFFDDPSPNPDFGENYNPPTPTSGLDKVQELKTKIREEEDETKRQKLADELTKEMQKLFEEDFQKRDEEVKKLEDRVSKLRGSLDKRKAARDRIIKNRIEAILLEADGLGLPGERLSLIHI